MAGCFSATINKKFMESEIEIQAERMQDRLDRLFLKSPMTQSEYEAECVKICEWVKLQYEISLI